MLDSLSTDYGPALGQKSVHAFAHLILLRTIVAGIVTDSTLWMKELRPRKLSNLPWFYICKMGTEKQLHGVVAEIKVNC